MRLVDFEMAAIDIFNEGLLMAPVTAIPRLLARRGLKFDDVALWEIHEAFSAQAALSHKALEDERFVRERAGVSHNFGNFSARSHEFERRQRGAWSSLRRPQARASKPTREGTRLRCPRVAADRQYLRRRWPRHGRAARELISFESVSPSEAPRLHARLSVSPDFTRNRSPDRSSTADESGSRRDSKGHARPGGFLLQVTTNAGL